MMNGRNNGKKLMAVRIVAHAFEIVCLPRGEPDSAVTREIWHFEDSAD
jgi:ribosomal protein S7